MSDWLRRLWFLLTHEGPVRTAWVTFVVSFGFYFWLFLLIVGAV